MKTIRNNQLFEELQKAKFNKETFWNILKKYNDKDGIEIPVMIGGIDHIERTPTSIHFLEKHTFELFDDSSFVIRRENIKE